MKRFMLLTFGFLGWAWYELSGGADFEPGALTAAVEVEETPLVSDGLEVTRAATTSVIAPLPDLPAATDEAAAPEATVDTEAEVVQVAATTEEAATIELEPTTDTLAAATDAPVIVTAQPATIAPVVVTRREIEPQRAALDLREVTGSRVNMRDGPGTDYGIVTRLLRGDEVEVLDDNGDGWVRIEARDTGERGWMADFLLTAAAQ